MLTVLTIHLIYFLNIAPISNLLYSQNILPYLHLHQKEFFVLLKSLKLPQNYATIAWFSTHKKASEISEALIHSISQNTR